MFFMVSFQSIQANAKSVGCLQLGHDRFIPRSGSRLVDYFMTMSVYVHRQDIFETEGGAHSRQGVGVKIKLYLCLIN
jgi:hypothetical protein